MTKGAAVASAIFAVIIIALFVQEEQTIFGLRHTNRVQDRLILSNKRLIAAQVAANDSTRKLVVRVNLLAKEGAKARVALCVVQRSLRRRVDASVSFLASHPGERTIFGIPIGTILAGIQRDRDDIKALDVLDCKP